MSSISALSSASGLGSRDALSSALRGPTGGAGSFGKILDAQMKNPSAVSGATDIQLLQALSQGSNLIGKSVVYSKNGNDLTAKGVVQGLKVESGRIQLVIGGNSVPLDRVRSLGA